MKTEEFNYYLPEELIAQTPSEPRDSSRLLVYDRKTGSITHGVFKDVINYINKGDVLVINNTRVLPARLMGKTQKGGTVEVLLLKRLDVNTWEVLTKPGKKARTGSRITFSDELCCTVKAYGEEGIRIVRFDFDGVFEDIINTIGLMPLPHYIKEELEDKERYQTVYSRISGSAAAPTAGLHFTKPLLEKIKEKGAEIAEVLLHVGLGTFRPVSSENIEEHKLHSEYYEVSENTAQIINRAKAESRRVIAVGTTSVRVLESIADEKGFIKSCKGETNIFIYPPYKFKCVQSLITNFHLPKSSLIMLVSAFAGKEETLKLYETAVKEKYRFFSFGDAMMIL
jgi:S-adenosylmethionine:tRNA ribosyltransferase-isomerase